MDGAMLSLPVVPVDRHRGEPLEIAAARQRFIQSLPYRFRYFVEQKHKDDVKAFGYAKANRNLFQYENDFVLKGTGIKGSSSIDEVKEYSELIAARLERDFLAMVNTAGMGKAMNLLLSELDRRNVKFPCDVFLASKQQRIAALARVFDPSWWKRGLLRVQRFAMEHIARTAGMVTRKTSAYASHWAIDRREEQKIRNRWVLEGLEMVNADNPDEVLNLLECVDASTANPVNRRHELMTRIAGFEQYADWMMHEAVFYTFTCPSKYHCKHSVSGKTNRKYNGSTPKQAQAYLCAQWAKIRAKLHREEIPVYGFRVAEPHHDGTPHWHMLLFMPAKHKARVTEVFSHYAFEVDGNERGAKKHRFEAVDIDKSKGSAAGYIAKYIAKNIDGAHVDVDEEAGDTGSNGAIHVDAWAATWGIRQFQQIGGPSVTIWRELRKLSEDEAKAHAAIDADDSSLKGFQAGLEGDDLFKVWQAADSGDWAQYCLMMGGVEAKNSDRQFQIWREDMNLSFEMNYTIGDEAGLGDVMGAMDEALPDEEDLYLFNKYGEPTSLVMGIRGVKQFFKTRLKTWEIRRAGGSGFEGANAPPWSSVNNCTDDETELINLDYARGSGC